VGWADEFGRQIYRNMMLESFEYSSARNDAKMES